MPGSDDEHAFLGERGQRASQPQMMRGAELRLQRQLHHRNLVLRIHPLERDPCSVVESSATVDAGGDIGALERRYRFGGDFRRARSRITLAIELLRESAEVVNRLRLG